MLLSRSLLAAALSLVMATSNAQAVPKAPDAKTPNPAPMAPADGKPKAASDETKSIEDFTKEATKIPGVLNFYRQKKGTSDAVYVEVPDDILNKNILIQITSSTGLGDTGAATVFHGAPITDVLVRFQKLEDGRIILIRPNIEHRASVAEIKRMISRSFPDEILSTFDVKAKQADRKSSLIDVTGFFKSDVAELSREIDNAFILDPSRTTIDTVKSFSDNAVIRTIYSVIRKPGPFGASGPKVTTWAVSYNVSLVPDHDEYKPRLGDSRIGYFTVNFQTLDDQTQRDQTVNYIRRWHLVKADPKAAMSAPVKPIVWYIDNSVPLDFRDDVKKGILSWNAAFAPLGFKDPIEVRQMPDNADWDIADQRYNVVRWTTGFPFAIALMRSNPLTGEIISAAINFDGVFAVESSSSFDEVIDPAGLYPSPTSPTNLKNSDMVCELPMSSARIAAEGANIFESLQTAAAPFNRNLYIHQRIQNVVVHEMGHCLGLRHNFVGSTQLTPAQLSDPKYVAEHGTTSSIMDYVSYNIYALKHKGVPFFTLGPSDYDKWAISYGYTPVDSETPQGERFALNMIASKSGEVGHRYLSDGTADDFDPSDVRYDFSADPVAWAQKTMDVNRYLLVTASERRVKPGKSYYDFSRSWIGAYNGYVRAASYVPRYIGGVYLSNSYKGDTNELPPMRPVDTAKQRKALALLNQYVFGENAMNFPKADLAKLTFNPNAPSNEASGRSRLFPIRDSIANFQEATLRRVLSSDTLQRIANNEFRQPDTLSLAELFKSLNGTVWSELHDGHEISDVRRELQRRYLDQLTDLAIHKDALAPSDARAIALSTLENLKSQISLAIPTAKGPYGQAHLRECLARIKQALSVTVTTAE